MRTLLSYLQNELARLETFATPTVNPRMVVDYYVGLLDDGPTDRKTQRYEIEARAVIETELKNACANHGRMSVPVMLLVQAVLTMRRDDVEPNAMDWEILARAQAVVQGALADAG
jgi:hypothetical protein